MHSSIRIVSNDSLDAENNMFVSFISSFDKIESQCMLENMECDRMTEALYSQPIDQQGIWALAVPCKVLNLQLHKLLHRLLEVLL